MQNIVHETSCSYTHPQNRNRVAEHKNRYILEVTSALLFLVKVLKRFWMEAVLTRTQFIDHMPSRILDEKTPRSLLMTTREPFLFTSRVFCMCSLCSQSWPEHT